MVDLAESLEGFENGLTREWDDRRKIHVALSLTEEAEDRKIRNAKRLAQDVVRVFQLHGKRYERPSLNVAPGIAENLSFVYSHWRSTTLAGP